MMLMMLVFLGALGGAVLKRRGPDGAAVLKRTGSDAHDAGLLGCSGWPCVETEVP